MTHHHDPSRTPVRDTTARVAWEATFQALDLAALGWSTAVRSAPAELLAAHPGAVPARVARVDRGRLLLVARGDGTLVHARDRTDQRPVVGDWVLVQAPALGAGGHPFARAVLPRAGVLARRRDTESTRPQVLAANVDLVLVAEALAADRTVNDARAARLVALAEAGGSEALVLLTGADRVPDDAVPDQVAGKPVITTSVVDGRGVDALRVRLGPGTTAVIVGASGAGKSSLANALLGVPVLTTGDTRAIGAGRHTTSVARLVALPSGGLLVDTPGIRGVGMHADVDASAIAPAAIDELATGCRFTDCRHETEPGCAVVAAIEAGRLSGAELAAWRVLEREALRERARSDDRLRRELGAETRRVNREVERARRRGEIVERRR